MEVTDRSSVDETVKKEFIKDDSIGKLMAFRHLKINRSMRKIKIKIELDTNPPSGSRLESKFHHFPFPFSVVLHDMTSLFARKNHALLCREYTKGRDWYDFIWYASRKTPINFELLSSALDQQGPWAGQKPKVDVRWYLDQMDKKIRSTDWVSAKRDVSRFLKESGLKTLGLWSTDFFLSFLDKLRV